ncbi:type II toxin-antitoxin system VapC family toxin [Desulfonatronum thioautotrophicum]|uniref:type II toxin-antitoxin system VapC family toxin n=1 Tax=Desulfonatronum thioautotrophicum TaxID=617001 RepID=UPI0005EB7392|nr:PIN domain-containing protein [Desulfonatronum thioautotrophicum]
MNALLDTGPWVALIDSSEESHGKCVEWFSEFRGKLYSTEPVLTEVLYLLNFSLKAQHACMDYVLRGIVTLVPTDVQALKSARMLMSKYADLPMDFADATLVLLASESQILNIVTLDHRDFGVYRTLTKKSFQIFP